jgi:ABC-type Fe3+-siderophore transport system permease subunit
MPYGGKVRYRLLRVMYAWTLVSAAALGLGMILAPSFMTSTLRLPAQDPFMIGVTGSFCLGSAIVAIFGLRSPLKFVPLLFLQVCYKIIWFVMVLLPRLVGGQFPFHAMVLALVFVTYVIGDLIAIPFGWLFAREA